MSDAWAALRDGAGRVNRAPALLFGVWALTLAVTALPAAVMARTIARDLGQSLEADAAAEGINDEWLQEFSERQGGLASTLRPTILGFGAVLDNLGALADGAPRPAPVVAIGAAYVGVWLFLAGGIIDRYARDRATHAYGFFAACGVFFFRFLRLAAGQAIVYGALFWLLHPWLFDRVYPRLVAAESTAGSAVAVRVAFYLVFGALAAAANLVFDYAKVRAVVEDRRSMAGALAQSLGFVRRNTAAAAALYVADAALLAVAMAAYAALAPGVGRGGLVWAVLAVGQLFVAVRLWIKLLFWASETALFQARLAHAGYVAGREPVWPDSPAAEAL